MKKSTVDKYVFEPKITLFSCSRLDVGLVNTYLGFVEKSELPQGAGDQW